jgi:hypothetical protein
MQSPRLPMPNKRARPPLERCLAQSQAKRKLATILKVATITNRGHQRCRAQLADAFDSTETLALLAAAVELGDSPIIGRYPSVDLATSNCSSPTRSRTRVAKTITIAPHKFSEAPLQLGDVACNDDSMFAEYATDLIDEPCPTPDSPATNTINRLYRQMINGFHRYEAHVRSPDR